MKTSKVIALSVLLLLVLMLSSCGNNKVKGESESYPEWYLSQDDPDHVCTYGFATKVNQRLSVESARANALEESAIYVKARVSSMLEDYMQEAGEVDPQVLSMTETAIKVVSDNEFSGILPGRMETRNVQVDGEGRYTTYIQLKIPNNEISKQVYDFVRKEEAMYSEFKASQAFKELERSLEKD